MTPSTRYTLLTKPKATHARLIHRLEINPQTCLLTFAATGNGMGDGSQEGVSFADRGGQYIIIDTGHLTAEGRPLKRAYSLVPTMLPFAARDRLKDGEVPFTLGIYRLSSRLSSHLSSHENGAMAPTPFGSEHLWNANLDTVFSFSGPWGRLAPDSVLKGEPVDGTPPSAALIIAVGTGITGGLGLFCSKVLKSVHQPHHLLWLDTGGFLSHEVVTETIHTHNPSVTGPGYDASEFTRVVVGEHPQTAGGLQGEWATWTRGCLEDPDFQDWTLYYLGDGRFYPGLESWLSSLKQNPVESLKKEFYYHRPQEDHKV